MPSPRLGAAVAPELTSSFLSSPTATGPTAVPPVGAGLSAPAAVRGPSPVRTSTGLQQNQSGGVMTRVPVPILFSGLQASTGAGVTRVPVSLASSQVEILGPAAPVSLPRTEANGRQHATLRQASQRLLSPIGRIQDTGTRVLHADAAAKAATNQGDAGTAPSASRRKGKGPAVAATVRPLTRPNAREMAAYLAAQSNSVAGAGSTAGAGRSTAMGTSAGAGSCAGAGSSAGAGS